MTEGIERSLLGQQLLVGHRVEGVGEAEGRAAGGYRAEDSE